MKGVTYAWLAFIGVATWKWETAPDKTSSLPSPSLYLGAAVGFSVLGLLAGPVPELAAPMAWALVVAAGVSGTLLPKPSSTAKPKPKAAHG